MLQAFKPIYENSKIHDINNDYKVGEKLGSGTYSVVYKGQSKATKEDFAIKVMSKSTDIDEMSSILEEITIMEFIKGCDNVVRLMDVYETHDKIMLVLDLVVGGELFEKIVARGSYSEKDAAYALKQMMTALSQIHSKRIIHRDLKPENILCVHTSLTLPEEIKIADFGESIVLLPGEYTNELRGSPCYIAPEVWLNKDYDMCSDMWSMGVIAFILLGGYLPFQEPPQENPEERDELAISEVIIKGVYQFHPQVWGDTSAVAKDFVSKLLLVDTTKRMTAEEALKHPFLAKSEAASTVHMNKAVQNLKSFNAKRRWQALAQIVIATNKLQMLSGLAKTETPSGLEKKKSKIGTLKSALTKRSNSTKKKV